MSEGKARAEVLLRDMTATPDTEPAGWFIMLVRTERGQAFRPYPVKVWDEYTREFGGLMSDCDDPLVIQNALKQGARILVTKLIHCTDPSDPSSTTAAKAQVDLNDRGDVPTPGVIQSPVGPFLFSPAQAGTTEGTEVEAFTFEAGVSDQFSVRLGKDGVWEDPQTFTLTGSLQTAAEVVAQVNGETEGITASAASDTRLKVTANDPEQDVEILTVSNHAYGVLGLTVGVYEATGTDKLVIQVDGGVEQEFSLQPENSETGDFWLTAGQIANQIAGIQSATRTATNGVLTIQTNSTGPSASIQVLEESTATAVLGFDNDVHSGTTGVAQPTARCVARDYGKFGNDIRVQIWADDQDPTLFEVRVIYLRDRSLDERWPQLNMDPESDRYFVTHLNDRSRLTRWVDLESTNPNPANLPAVNMIGVALTGGDDGGPLDDSDYIGDQSAQTGIYAADKEKLGVHIGIPGTCSHLVNDALSTYCQNHGMRVPYFEFPEGWKPDEIYAFRKGEAPYTHVPFNTPYGAYFAGRPKVWDPKKDAYTFTSNLGHLAACIAATEANEGWGRAFVGPNRGKVKLVYGLDTNLGEFPGWADFFAEAQINYLQITEHGAEFWEERTTQQHHSDLQHLSVLCFCIYALKQLLPYLRLFLFEPNHPKTWRLFHNNLQPVIEEWKNRAKIYDYVLQTDKDAYIKDGDLYGAILNTGLDLQLNRYNARVLVKTVEPIYWIMFEMGLVNKSVGFGQYTMLRDLPGNASTMGVA